MASKLRVVVDEAKLGEALHAALPPDVVAPPEVGFVHRHLADAEVYFVANTSNHAVQAPTRFRVTGLQPAQWSPLNGEMTSPERSHFAPYESRIMVFSKAKVPPPLPMTREYPWLDLGTGWRVTFGSSEQATALSSLRSWTEEEGRRYYSGQATYERSFGLLNLGRRMWLTFGEGTPVTTDDRRSGPGMRAMLDGPVREAAIVYVNGKRAGSVWCPPYEVNVTGLVHIGENTVRIVVANSALNEMAGTPLPDYKALSAKYGERFQPQEMNLVAPQPSGLLGPVRLVVR